MRRVIFGLLVCWLLATPGHAQQVRVKDIARVQSVRANQLVGYGLVVGLAGTGDTRQSPFTIQSVVSMLQRFGVSVDVRTLKPRNLAAVMVTTDLPAFAKEGSRLDVQVSSLGDATALQGGILLQTPLVGADDQVYAVAQGAVSIGGFSAGGGGTTVTKNHPTAGRIPGGALVEREVLTRLQDSPDLLFINLHQPDFGNAQKVADAINAAIGSGAATAADAATVRIQVPPAYQAQVVRLIADIGEVQMVPDPAARVVLNERTGTIVIGGAVRLSPAAVAHGSLMVDILTDFGVSQPPPLSRRGDTVVVPRRDVRADEPKASLMELPAGTTIAEIVKALNALKVSPRDVIAIIQALHDAGALHAEVVLE
ncbi:MAG: flagellar basal body P-ring protein FlgI [Armatimonadetes bacterium]|nr:flagellar basal body P-ring protein FlgI [Armatimonadota bacterium]